MEISMWTGYSFLTKSNSYLSPNFYENVGVVVVQKCANLVGS